MKSLLLPMPRRGLTPRRFVPSTRLSLGFLAVALALSALSGLAASGTVTFANHGSSKVINGHTSNAVTSAEGVKVALYWLPPGSNTFVQIGALANVGIPVPGVFSGGTRTTGTNTIGGTIGQFQVRAWSGAAATYEQALATAGVLIGQSAIIQVVTGDPAGDPPMPPGSLIAGGLPSFTVLSNSSPPLVINCITDKTVPCESNWTFDPPTASGGCISNPFITVISTVATGSCPQVITRTWQADDGCGNSASCSQTVTVVDTTPPFITCASNKTVECGSTWNFDLPGVFDACCTNVTIQFLSTNSTVISPCQTVWTGVWQAMDCCSNIATCTQTVTVVDMTPPVVTCASNKTVECGTAWDFDPPIYFDLCCLSNQLSLTIVSTTTDESDPCHKLYVRIWQVTDCCSNSITCTQTVSVVDTTPPVITCPTNKAVECGSAWSFDQPDALDACCTNVTIQLLSSNATFVSFCQTVWEGVWQAMDCCSNISTCTQTVTVVDTTPPVPTCASNKTVMCGNSWSFDSPTAFDLCCGTNVTISVFSTVTNNTSPRVVTQTWEITDCCSNDVYCSQTVTESLPLPITLLYSLDSSGFHLVFTTETGPTYIVEYQDNLTDPSWTTLQMETGDGLTHDVIDPVPLASMRYYRVRIVCP